VKYSWAGRKNHSIVLRPTQEYFTIWRRHHCRWRAAIFRPNFGAYTGSGPLSREGSSSFHTCWDTVPRFFWSHPKDRPNQSPLTTRIKGCGESILTRILTGQVIYNPQKVISTKPLVLFVCLFIAAWAIYFVAHVCKFRPMLFRSEGSFSCDTYCDTGPRFIRSHPKDRHPRPTVGLKPDLCASALTTAPCGWLQNH
jgi:hypothetical protein